MAAPQDGHRRPANEDEIPTMTSRSDALAMSAPCRGGGVQTEPNSGSKKSRLEEDPEAANAGAKPLARGGVEGVKAFECATSQLCGGKEAGGGLSKVGRLLSFDERLLRAPDVLAAVREAQFLADYCGGEDLMASESEELLRRSAALPSGPFRRVRRVRIDVADDVEDSQLRLWLHIMQSASFSATLSPTVVGANAGESAMTVNTSRPADTQGLTSFNRKTPSVGARKKRPVTAVDGVESAELLTLVDWRWARAKGFYDPFSKTWNEEKGGLEAYLEAVKRRRSSRERAAESKRAKDDAALPESFSSASSMRQPLALQWGAGWLPAGHSSVIRMDGRP